MLKLHEGLRLQPYTDTVGKITIGYGRNLSDRGITRDEAEQMLAHDITTHLAELVTVLPWVRALDPVRQAVLADMAFNMGVPTLLTFKNTLAAVKAGNYEGAAANILDSKYADQVGGRALRLARMLRHGTVPAELEP